MIFKEVKKKETEEHQKEGNLRIYNGKDGVKLNQRRKKNRQLEI